MDAIHTYYTAQCDLYTSITLSSPSTSPEPASKSMNGSMNGERIRHISTTSEDEMIHEMNNVKIRSQGIWTEYAQGNAVYWHNRETNEITMTVPSGWVRRHIIHVRLWDVVT